MTEYVVRLINCGFTVEEAYKDCCDFLRDFSLFELQNYVTSMEAFKNVGKIQSKPYGQICG